MASTANCDMTAFSEEMLPASACACSDNDEAVGNNRFFRGILIAIPAGLLAWAGLLRIAGEVLHRL